MKNCIAFGSPLVKQGKYEGFDSCDRLTIITQIGFKSLIFLARMIKK